MNNFRLHFLVITTLLIGLVQAKPVHAQDDRLNIDLFLDADLSPLTSNASLKVEHNGLVYFTATEPETGKELWVTDGTDSGTFMLKDIATDQIRSSFLNPVIFKDHVYFVAASALDASSTVLTDALWKTDGTPEGTTIVYELEEPFHHMFTLQVTEDKIFLLNSISSKFEIWVSDGTRSSTRNLFDEDSQPGRIASTSFKVVDNKILFQIDEGDIKSTWISDGTDDGTYRIYSKESNLTGTFNILGLVNGNLYLSQSNTELGVELWVTDLSPNSLHLVKDIFPGNNSSQPEDAVVFNNKLYFNAKEGFSPRRLWCSDGTESGTVKVNDIEGNEIEKMTSMFVFQDTLFHNFSGGFYKSEVVQEREKILDEVIVKHWEVGEKLLLQTWYNDLYLYEDGVMSLIADEVRGLTIQNNFAFFIESDVHRRQYGLWSIDLTDADVQFLMFLRDDRITTSIEASVYIDNILPLNNGFLFKAFKEDTNEELWFTDGTQEGTRFFKDINTGTESADITAIGAAGDNVYFSTSQFYNSQPYGRGVYVKNDFADTIVQIFDKQSTFKSLGDKMLFLESNSSNEVDTIYISDGTVDGTHPLLVVPGLYQFYQFDNKMFITSIDGTWITDGTVEGSFKLLDDIRIGGGDLSARLGDKVIFRTSVREDVNSTEWDNQLWITDGTIEGTKLVKSAAADGSRNLNFEQLRAYENRIYFSNGSKEIWVSDGTENGTNRIFEAKESIRALLPYKDKLFYTTGGKLWAYDFLTNKDSLVHKDNSYSFIDHMRHFNNKILMTGGSSARLVITEGDSATTKVLTQDLSWTSGFNYFDIDNQLFFNASDRVHGDELWYTNGTQENTYMVDDLNVGGVASKPKNFIEHKDKVLFIAENSRYGREIFYVNHYYAPNVEGVLFHDVNGNGIQDPGEPGLANVPILIDPTGLYIYTDENGYFAAEIEVGSFELIPQFSDCWAAGTTAGNGGSSGSFVNNEQKSYQKSYRISIPAVPSEGTVNIIATVESSLLRCNSEAQVWASLLNRSCGIFNGRLELILPDSVHAVSVEPAASIANNVITWDVDGLPSYNSFSPNVIVKLPNEEFVGDTLRFEVNVISETENMETPEEFLTTEGVLRCAIDPNDKLVTPRREEITKSNYTQLDEALKYTIRFQNTGNDTAFNVTLKDQLSANLDLTTFLPLSSSHKNNVELDKNGLLTIYFSNIYLPDSIVNEPLSHGYFSYLIKAKEGIADFETVSNTAGIYFDANKPIITNTVTNTIVEKLDKDLDTYFFYQECDDNNPNVNPGVEEIVNNGVDDDCNGEELSTSTVELGNRLIKVYPNPTINSVKITIDKQFNYRTTIYDLQGKLLLTSINSSELSLEHFPQGIYLLEIKDINTNQKVMERIMKL